MRNFNHIKVYLVNISVIIAKIKVDHEIYILYHLNPFLILDDKTGLHIFLLQLKNVLREMTCNLDRCKKPIPESLFRCYTISNKHICEIFIFYAWHK